MEKERERERERDGGERRRVASTAHESLSVKYISRRYTHRATCFRRKRRPGSNRFETEAFSPGEKLRFYSKTGDNQAVNSPAVTSHPKITERFSPFLIISTSYVYTHRETHVHMYHARCVRSWLRFVEVRR